MKNPISKRHGTLFLLCAGLQLALCAPPAWAQYESYSVPRLLTELRNMLEGMDRVVRELDANAALAVELKREKTALDRESEEIDDIRAVLKQQGDGHNAEVEQFNAECLEETLTTREDGERCYAWSDALNERNAELTAERDRFNARVDAFNARVDDYNRREEARAAEAARLDSSYDDYETNATVIEGYLARRQETQDIARRCNQYNEAETRQQCMQDIWSRESETRPYTRNQEL